MNFCLMFVKKLAMCYVFANLFLLFSSAAKFDYSSLLNIVCQKCRLHLPEFRECPGAQGGFGYKCRIGQEWFEGVEFCTTKKDAKHECSKWALLGIDIPGIGIALSILLLILPTGGKREKCLRNLLYYFPFTWTKGFCSVCKVHLELNFPANRTSLEFCSLRLIFSCDFPIKMYNYNYIHIHLVQYQLIQYAFHLFLLLGIMNVYN